MSKKLFYIVAMIVLMVSCGKDPAPSTEVFRLLKEKEQVAADITTVAIAGEYAYSGVVDGMILRLGTEPHLYGSEDHPCVLQQHAYSVKVEGLEANTLYYYRYVVDYGAKTEWYSDIYAFTTADDIHLPTVVTMEVTGVTVTTASCLCHVADDGGAEVVERGACWSTSPQPDITDLVYAHGSGLGDYQVSMVDLHANTTYYVRAYAKNRRGVNYGEELSFTTNDYLNPPLGASNGLFTVGEDRQVWIAVGNLMYHPKEQLWSFAENAYDYVGNDNALIASDYDGWIDLFGWGTSGYPHRAACYQPWSWNSNPDLYFAYDDPNAQLYDQTGQADWGYNDLFGEGEEGRWRTMTVSEWDYVLNQRNTPSGIRFAKAQVNGVNGLILLPDGWSNSVYYLSNVNQYQTAFSSNVIYDGWETFLQQNGAVFLPAAGKREEKMVDGVGACGFYYTSESSVKRARGFTFDHRDMGDITVYRSDGLSVRLVRDADMH